MFESAAAAYVMAVFAMLFAAASGLTLIWAVNHFDPPDARAESERHVETVGV